MCAEMGSKRQGPAIGPVLEWLGGGRRGSTRRVRSADLRPSIWSAGSRIHEADNALEEVAPPTVMTHADLYERGMRTAAVCWAAFARSTSGAEVHRLPHVSVAVFPDEPERSIYNNSILELYYTAGPREESHGAY